jgi:hypothetical protein
MCVCVYVYVCVCVYFGDCQDGSTAMDIARRNGHAEVVKALERAADDGH